jgi:hypothetical protein
MDVEIRYFEDCPSWQDAERSIRSLADDLGIDASIRFTLVDSPERAEELSFRGSPTILFDGTDPWDDPDAPVGLSCRIYRTDDGFAGVPDESQLRGALADRR